MNPDRSRPSAVPALSKEQIKTLINEWGERTIAEFADLFNVPERSINKTVKEIRKSSGNKYCPVIRGIDTVLRNRVKDVLADL